jgi:hypothetical protein
MIMQALCGELRMALNEKNLTNVRLFVIPIGFEPMTYRLEICCSIQLSYGTMRFFAVQICKNPSKIEISYVKLVRRRRNQLHIKYQFGIFNHMLLFVSHI